MTRTALLLVATLVFCAALAFAAGDVEHGRKLFTDPALGGSANDLSCDSCHPSGSGLEGSGARDYSSSRAKTLEGQVNICIAGPLRGKALPTDSREMADLVAYIKSLGR